ncbi:hypothetical protein LOD99_3508 [Oopsacas minuta]|uniref:Ribonuclease P protein subunit p29 n=1 Tax=Oopsacas minuta TaxID=111878 RepID=A0AAV7JX63_9METZ|nr:hypothetical protein LOD99_3508 [Oopsacas minuta]
MELLSSFFKESNPNKMFEDFIFAHTQTTKMGEEMISKLRHQVLLFEKPASEKVKKCKKPKNIVGRQKIMKSIGDIPNESIKYYLFIPMYKLWQQYAAEVLGKVISNPTKGQIMSNCQKLVRLDYHGCLITVLDSKCNSYIGHTGIVIKESQNTFTIVTLKDERKTIPKRNTVFAFNYGNVMFKLFGNNFRVRPSLRCSKRFKDKPTTEYL